MTSIKKQLNKKILTIILAVAIMVIFATILTVNAWFLWSNSIGIAGGAEITAAKIDATAKVNSLEIGIPGEPGELNITIEDKDSNRAYVYEIALPEENEVAFQNSESEYALGTVNFGDIAEILGLVKIDNKIYGVMNPGDTTDITIPVEVYYYGVEVIDDDPAIDGGPYDGNATQGNTFTLPGIEVKYCQATPAAIADVFSLGETDVAELMEGVN